MLRFVISLDDHDKAWLSQIADAEKTSLAAVIRKAIHLYQKKMLKQKRPTFDTLLTEAQHTWTQGNALDYQTKVRDEWER